MDISAPGPRLPRAAGSHILRPLSPASTYGCGPGARAEARRASELVARRGHGGGPAVVARGWPRAPASATARPASGDLWRQWRQQDPSGRITRLIHLRLASLADRHVLVQSVAVTAENYAGRISLASRLAPSDDARTDTALMAAEPTVLHVRVSETEIAIASASELRCAGAPSHQPAAAQRRGAVVMGSRPRRNCAPGSCYHRLHVA